MRHIRVCLAIVCSIGASDLSAQSSTRALASMARYWRCDVQQKWECELPGGCKRLEAERSWVLLDFRASTYQRCDRFGCDKYGMVVKEQSFFTYITLPEHPDAFMKIGLAGFFLDVASVGVSGVNSLGVCAPQK